jgi:hypothetical protein
MKAKPLSAMGRWRGMEAALEVTVPLTVTGTAWYVASTLLSKPSAGRPMTPIEVFILLGVCGALTGWMVSRNLFMARKRSPWTLVIASSIITVGFAYGVGSSVVGSFEDACTGPLAGKLVDAAPIDVGDSVDNAGAAVAPGSAVKVCKVGGVVDNPYLLGTVFRPTWDGALTLPLTAWLLLNASLAALGLRHVRVRPTQITANLMNLLRFAPSAGGKTAMHGDKPKMGKVQACNNPTLWGETCGQVYPIEKKWYPGEWCSRCQQAFHPAPRRFTFKVVSLFAADVDILNGIERLDTVSWPRGEPIAPDARISGQERWVTLGSIDFPDVITVAQALALLFDALPKWAESTDVRVQVAGGIALERASRVAAWIWRGQLSHRLTYARPNNDIVLALGPQRLRDLIEDGADELWLQLDVGLLPLELRTGFKKTWVEEGRLPDVQNSKFDLWMPVANPHAPKSEGGLWVPRVEGDALRLWLSLDRLRDERIKGVTLPLPYLRYEASQRGTPPPGHDRAPKPGSLDLVRYPFAPGGMEPSTERAIGASLTEWDWLEWRQIELLRQECIVLEQV